MKINKDVCSKFRGDFDKAVVELEERYGVRVDLGNITFSDEKFSCKMTVRDSSSYDSVNKLAIWHDDPKSVVGMDVWHPKTGELYTVVEYAPSRPKYCYTIKNKDALGKQYRISRKHVIDNLVKVK